MTAKPGILFIKKYDTNAKFITNDIELLQERYNVKLNSVKTNSIFYLIISLILQFFFLIYNILNTKVIYIWFADHHSILPVFIAKIFNRKSVICAGGYECTYIPEINCGVFTKGSISKRIRHFCVEYSLKNCSLILPVDESLINNVNTYIYSDVENKPPLEDGIKTLIPGITTPIKAINLGYDSRIFNSDPSIKKENSVLSAGLIVNEDEYNRKGFDLLVEAASQMPDIKFILVGLNNEFTGKLKKLNISNLELYGIISFSKLIEAYQRSKIFAQISMFEGMPSTLCEAMLCECIPVGSNVNGIPGIISDTGYIVYKKDINNIINTLRNALHSTDELGKKAKERIMTNYSIQNRKIRLNKEIENIISQ